MTQPLTNFIEQRISRRSLLSATTFAIAAGISCYLPLSIWGTVWGYVAVIYIAILTFTLLLFRETVNPLVVHLAFFVAFSWAAIRSFAPYGDQYFQYSLIKPMEFFSPFPKRHLYSAYRDFPENSLPRDALGFDYRYWDYPYLPGSLIPSFFHHLFDCDPRIPFLAIELFVGISFWYFARGTLAELLSLFFLVVPLVNVTFPPLYLCPSIFVLAAVIAVSIAYKLRDTPILAAPLLSLALITQQFVWIYLPFIAIPFICRNGRRTVAFGLVCAAAVICATSAPSVENFIKDTVLVHSLSDYEYLAAGGKVSTFSFLGWYSQLSGKPATELVAQIPLTLLGAVSYVAVWVLAYVKRKRLGIFPALYYGTAGAMAVVFFTKFAWGTGRYLFILSLVLVLRDQKNITETVLSIQKQTARYIFGSLVLVVTFFALYLKHLGDVAYRFPAGDKRMYVFTEIENDTTPGALQIHPQDALRAQASRPITLHRTSGWANSQLGHQFWVLTPPGRYRVTACDLSDNCQSKEIEISVERSFALRIPFGFTRRNNSWVLKVGTIGSVEIADAIISLTNPKIFSVERLAAS